tara:strand:- start:9175 stop:10194 length:1020 start_codon:yes stop_codon:yes gene_type:complete
MIKALTSTDMAEKSRSYYGFKRTWSDERCVVELLLHELAAHKSLTRRVLLKRVLAFADPFFSITEEHANELLNQLLLQGDILTGGYGILAGAPLRGVVFPDEHIRVLCALPTSMLEELLGLSLESAGHCRVSRELALCTEKIEQLGGGVITLADWLGLDDADVVDDKWLSSWEARVELAEEVASLGEIFGELRPQCYQPTKDRLQYRCWEGVDELCTFSLLRVRADRGYRHVLAKPGGEGIRFLECMPEDVARLCYAFDRLNDVPTKIHVEGRSEEDVLLYLENMLPVPEYRYLLSVIKDVMRDTFPMKFLLKRSSFEALQRLFERRLGVLFVSEAEVS